MRGRGWSVLGLVSMMGVTATSGCVSLDDHNRVKAQNRNLMANKQSVEQEMYEVRSANEALRARVDALASELGTNRQLVENYKSENQLLQEIHKNAQGQLEEMAGRQIGDIVISGPRLPAPLNSALKRFADEHPSEVVFDETGGKMKWRADVLFTLGSDVVKEASLESLRGFAEILKSPAASEFEAIVAGYTDSIPIVQPTTRANHPTNWHLSVHRAIAVSSVLQKYGYPPTRIGVMGYGEFRPVADNASAAGQSQNRRVEVYIVSRGMIAQSGSAGIDRSTK